MIRRENKKKAFFQWDSNQNVTLPAIDGPFEVHFCQSGKENALVVEPKAKGGQFIAAVPNILLQQASPIKVYIYRKDTGNYTDYKKVFLVIEREKPDNYIYTETEVLTYKALENRIKQLEKNSGGGTGGIVDQTYDPTSENAQSGIAIAGVIGDIETALDNIIAIQNSYINKETAE